MQSIPSIQAPPPEAKPEQLLLDMSCLLPWGEGRKNLTVPEVAEFLRLDQNSVRELVEMEELEAYRFTVFGSAQSRLTNRITRRGLLVWMCKKAKFVPSAIVEAILEIAGTLTVPLREKLIAGLQKQQKSKT